MRNTGAAGWVRGGEGSNGKMDQISHVSRLVSSFNEGARMGKGEGEKVESCKLKEKEK